MAATGFKHTTSLAICLSVRSLTKWLSVRIPLLSLKLQIWCLLRARNSLTFKQTIECRFTLKLIRDMITTYSETNILYRNLAKLADLQYSWVSLAKELIFCHGTQYLLTLSLIEKHVWDGEIKFCLLCRYLTVCSCHVTYAFQSESTLCSCLNAKELLDRSRREIWSLNDYNLTRTQNHLVCKWTLNQLPKVGQMAN